MRSLSIACIALAACSSGTPATGPVPADGRTAGDGDNASTPVLVSVSPDHGSVQGSDAVVLSGQNFAAGLKVVFGGRVATVTSVGVTSVSVLTPPGSVGVVDVSVLQAGQTVTLTGAFTYQCAGGDLSVPAQYASITLALGHAPPGGTILVCDGNYSELDTGEVFPLYVHDMHLVGAGAEVTEINANFANRIIDLAGDASVVGFSLKNGQAPLTEGGGVTITGEGSPRVAYNMLVGNSASDYGGAIFVDAPATPVIENNVFDGNGTTNGSRAGLGGAAIALNHTRAALRGNIFTNNHSASDGGAVFVLQILDIDRLTTIDGNLFEANAAIGSGGALMVMNGLTDKLLGNLAAITNNTFRNNGSAGLTSGGALACVADYSGPMPATAPDGPTLAVHNNRFETNSAQTGAAIALAQCDMSFAANDVVGNTSASASGGAVQLASPPDGTTPSLVDSNFTENSSFAVLGGGVLGQVDGHGNYLADNNGASGVDPTVCPKGIVDGDDSPNSDGDPRQFMFVDACLSMSAAPVLATGPATP